MWTHGSFFWNELMTRDVERSAAFYGDLLGWTFEIMPMPEGSGNYWVAKMDDRPVGGLFPMQGPEFEGMPDHWFSYIAVDDVDARVGRVRGAGGEVIREPFDVAGVGRIAIIKDATGAVIGWMTPVPMEDDKAC